MFLKGLFAFAFLTGTAAYAATGLPDACGSQNVKFDVSTDKPLQSAATPETGKAQIVFIESLHKNSNVLIYPTIRFGLDGSWAGAVKGSSYFAISVPPGEHHLCAAWQSHFKSFRDQPGAMPLTVEPGKIYFVDYSVNFIPTDGGAQPVISFAQINDDQAKFLLKSYPLATWTTKP